MTTAQDVLEAQVLLFDLFAFLSCHADIQASAPGERKFRTCQYTRFASDIRAEQD
jgi:hypothetical protein